MKCRIREKCGNQRMMVKKKKRITDWKMRKTENDLYNTEENRQRLCRYIYIYEWGSFSFSRCNTTRHSKYRNPDAKTISIIFMRLNHLIKTFSFAFLILFVDFSLSSISIYLSFPFHLCFSFVCWISNSLCNNERWIQFDSWKS